MVHKESVPILSCLRINEGGAGGGGGGQTTSQRAMRFMQAMEKKKSVIKLQIREEWFAMGM